MSQRRSRLVDAVETAVTIAVFGFVAVLSVFDALTGQWWKAVLFLLLAVVNLYSLRMLRQRIKRSRARLVELDAYIAAYEKRQDPEARP